MKRVPVFGWFFKRRIFHTLNFKYDTIVNFIDGHDHAISLLHETCANSAMIEKIKEESRIQTKKAETYMDQNITQGFAEVSKAIQNRRASFYILSKQYKYVEEMMAKGEIEDKEGGTLLHEIDKKIIRLQRLTAELQINENKDDAIEVSQLA